MTWVSRHKKPASADPTKVVAAARAWLGTPYHDQASLRGVGCDCLGLARGVWRDVIGDEPFAIPPYSRDWGEAGRGDPTRKQGRILSSKVLLKAGLVYANADAEAVPNNLKRMICQRDGMMIALLALLPIRRRSFCELELDQSVHLTEDEIIISLSEEMTKTGVPWEAAVPPQIAPLLRRYIAEVRPALLARGRQAHNVLWVGKRGEIMGENYIGSRIGDVTLRLTGKRVSPHLFRDCAATTLARLSPESARLIRPVLAHSGFRTAERHYIHAQTIDAGRDYAAVVQRLKKGR